MASAWPYLSETEHLHGGLLFVALLLGCACGGVFVVAGHMCWWASRAQLCPEWLPTDERRSYRLHTERTALPTWCAGWLHSTKPKPAAKSAAKSTLASRYKRLEQPKSFRLPSWQEVQEGVRALPQQLREQIGSSLSACWSSVGSAWAEKTPSWLREPVGRLCAFLGRLGACFGACCCCCCGCFHPTGEDGQSLLPAGKKRSDGKGGGGAAGGGGGGGGRALASRSRFAKPTDHLQPIKDVAAAVGEWVREVGLLAGDEAGRRQMMQEARRGVHHLVWGEVKKPKRRLNSVSTVRHSGPIAHPPARTLRMRARVKVHLKAQRVAHTHRSPM